MTKLFSESFETDGNGTRYTTLNPDLTALSEFSDGFYDFLTRTDGTNIGTGYEVSGVDGSSYFAVQDTNGDAPVTEAILQFTGIDIAGMSNLSFSALFAEDDSSDGNEDWDASSKVIVQARIDGGSYQDLLTFTNSGTTFNSEPGLDTTGDGVADGPFLSSTFQSFGASIVGTGSLLDLRVVFQNLDDGDEDIAIDLIEITGDSTETVVLDETFDDATKMSVAVGSEFFSDGSFDYFGISDGAGGGDFGGDPIPRTNAYTGTTGGFLTGSDLDGEGATVPFQVTWSGLNIAGLTGLKFTGDFGEFLDGLGTGGPDVGDYIHIEVSVDGGAFEKILAFEGADLVNGDNFNGYFYQDTDLDGVADDGITLGNALQNFVAEIGDTGSTLDLRVTVSANSGYEDFAFDNFRIVGTSGGTVNPAVLATSGDGLTVAEEGTTTDTFTLALSTDPAAPVTVTVSADAQSEVSLDGVTFSASVDAVLADSSALETITVRAIDDAIDESDPHTGAVSFSVTSTDPDYDGLTITPLTVTVEDNDVTVTAIHDIQGDGAESGMVGDSVVVEGIVTGLYYNAAGAVVGYFVQEEDADADADASTSEGIYVYDSGSTVSVGDKVQVEGTVTEYFGLTELGSASATVLSSGNALPTAVAITLAMGPDFEAYEGMRVELLSEPGADPLTVVANFDLDRYGSIQVAEGNQVQPTQVYDAQTQAAEIADLMQANELGRIIIDDSSDGQNPDMYRLLEGPDGTAVTPTNFDATAPALRLGTQLPSVEGIMGFGFDEYRIHVSDPLETIDANPRPETAPDVGGDLRVASFNVLNYFTTLDADGAMTGPDGDLDPRGATTAADLARQTEKLVLTLTELDADIVALEELENNGFGTDSAIATLVQALNDATAPGTYDFVEPTNTNGGFIGTDAITTGIIYKTDSVSLVGDAQVLVFAEDSAAETVALAETLATYGGSLDDLQRNRPAIAATFEDADGNEVTIVANHFKSKGSSGLDTLVTAAQNGGAPQELIDAFMSDPNYDQGDGQGFWNAVREDAAQELADWLATNPTGATDTSNVLILGDLNSYAMEDPIQSLEGDGFADLAESFIGADAYSYVFDGQRGTLDYGLASSDIVDNVTGVAEWHINSDEPDLLNYSSRFKDPAYFNPGDVFATSDHDPLVIGLDLTEEPEIVTVLARLDFNESRGLDKLVYSLDGEVQGQQRLLPLSFDIDVRNAGITIDADDGRPLSPSFLSTLGDGLGIHSAFGDRLFGRDARMVDQAETLSFSLDDDGGLGDAVEAQFEFARVKGQGQVELTFYDDGEAVETVQLSITDGMVEYALADGETFDRVDVGVTGGLSFALDAAEFLRIDPDGLDLA